jgi:hypothetical protein
MTATQLPVRSRPAAFRPPSPVPAWRLFWLELRHNPMPWTFPLLAALFVFDPFRTAMGYPAVWDVRASVLLNKMVPDFVVFVTGIAAWVGSRDGRRHTLELVEMTPRPRWAGQLAAWAATTAWAVIGFLAGVGVLYGVTATQVTWGGPPWWPVVVGCAELALLAALGFTTGALWPGRFTAPLAAVAAFVLSLEGFNNAVGRSSAFAVLSPTTYVPANDAGVFYPYPPDVAIDQLMLLAGLTVVVLGVLGLVRSSGAGPGLRRGVAVLTAAGAAAALTAVGLAGTARQLVPGSSRAASASAPLGMQSPWVIPALHDAAGDRPIGYRPVCVTATIPVCIHPAFQDFLPNVTAGLGPVLRELAGLPGAPVRVMQAPVGSLATPSGAVIGAGTAEGALDGAPPVFRYTADTLPARSFAQTPRTFSQDLRGALVAAFLPTQTTHASATGGQQGAGGQHGTPPGGKAPLGPGVAARLAVQSALLLVARVPLRAQSDALGPPYVPLSAAQQAQVSTAAQRLAALPAAARHAWLAAHLAALRAGHVTLAQLP